MSSWSVRDSSPTANCGLPYYIGGVITDPEELTLQTPQGFWNRFRVDVRVRHEAARHLHPAGRSRLRRSRILETVGGYGGGL